MWCDDGAPGPWIGRDRTSEARVSLEHGLDRWQDSVPFDLVGDATLGSE